MSSHPGIFIVLEGADGSGKKTQFDSLRVRLEAAGYSVAVFDFPRYDQPSAYFVTQYLNGHYGPASAINPYAASLFYALDRYQASAEIRQALSSGKIVLSNRYVGSNMAHQGAKFSEPIEKRSFFVWEDSLEYQILNIPRPDINLFLRVPAEVAYELISQKNQRQYTNKVRDEHEADINHLRQSVATYDLLCQLFPRDFLAIECAPGGKLMGIEQISQAIWAELKPLLPPQPARKDDPAKPAEVKAAQTEPSEITWRIDKISLLALDELRLRQIKPAAAPVWPAKSGLPYYVPASLKGSLKDSYCKHMEQAASRYKAALAAVGKQFDAEPAWQLLAPTVPLGATTKAELTVSKGAAIGLLGQFKRIGSREVIELSKQLSDLIEQTWPSVFKQAASSFTPAPEAIGSIIEKLTAELLPQQFSADGETAQLAEAVPKNEFDLLADGLYQYSSLSRPEIQAEIERWDYQKKSDALAKTLLRRETGLLELAKYKFDMLTSKLVLSLVLSANLANDIQAQPVSPRFGYSVPAEVEAAGADNDYLEAFDSSLMLYSKLQEAGAGQVADYASLLGHRLRWQATFSAAAIMKLCASKSPQLKQLGKALYDKVYVVHPLIADSLIAKPATAPRKPASRRRRSRGAKSKNS